MAKKQSSARKWADDNFTTKQLELAAQTNLQLVFNPKSPSLPVLHTLRDRLIEALTEQPLPEGLSPPIPSGKKRRPAAMRNVEVFLANVLDLEASGRPSLAVSLDPHTYLGSGVSSSGYINLVKLAAHESRDLVTLKKGFQDLRDPKKSRTARVKTRQKLRDLVSSLVVSEDDFVAEPPDLINLRVDVKGPKGVKKKRRVLRKEWESQLSPEQAKHLGIIAASLNWFNLVLHEYDISYRQSDGRQRNLFPILYAMFTNTFDRGGRLYTGRGGHQSLTKAERATIKLNGHPTRELDFGGLHVRMLYHLRGANLDAKRDPYADVLDVLGLNAKAVFRDHPAVRDDLKVLLLALVNGSGTPKQAVWRADRRMFRPWESAETEIHASELETEAEQRRKRWKKAGLLTGKGKPTTKAVMDAFAAAHKPIRADFSTGCGLRLQNIDAEFARWVMFSMMVSKADQCVPTLPVHDSFITFEKYEPKLRDAMTEAYQDVMRHETGKKKHFDIPVKTAV